MPYASQSSCIQRPLLWHIPSVQRSLFFLVLLIQCSQGKIPFNPLFPSTTCLGGCRAHFGALHFVWSLQLKACSLGWTFTKWWLPQENKGSHLSILKPCPACSAGLDEAALVTVNCDEVFRITSVSASLRVRVIQPSDSSQPWRASPHGTDAGWLTYWNIPISNNNCDSDPWWKKNKIKESQLSWNPRRTFALAEKT